MQYSKSSNQTTFICEKHNQQADLICSSPNCQFFFLCHFCTIEDLNHAIHHQKYLVNCNNLNNLQSTEQQNNSTRYDLLDQQVINKKHKISNILALQYKKTLDILSNQFKELQQQLNQQYSDQILKLDQVLQYYSMILRNQQSLPTQIDIHHDQTNKQFLIQSLNSNTDNVVQQKLIFRHYQVEQNRKTENHKKNFQNKFKDIIGQNIQRLQDKFETLNIQNILAHNIRSCFDKYIDEIRIENIFEDIQTEANCNQVKIYQSYVQSLNAFNDFKTDQVLSEREYNHQKKNSFNLYQLNQNYQSQYHKYVNNSDYILKTDHSLDCLEQGYLKKQAKQYWGINQNKQKHQSNKQEHQSNKDDSQSIKDDRQQEQCIKQDDLMKEDKEIQQVELFKQIQLEDKENPNNNKGLIISQTILDQFESKYYLICCTQDGSIIIFNIEDNKTLRKWQAHSSWTFKILLYNTKTEKGRVLVSCSIDGSLKIWKNIYKVQNNEPVYQDHFETQILSLHQLKDQISLGCRNGDLVMLEQKDGHEFEKYVDKQEHQIWSINHIDYNDKSYLLVGQNHSLIVCKYQQKQLTKIQKLDIHDKQIQDHIIFDIKTKQINQNQVYVVTAGSDSQAVLTILEFGIDKVDFKVVREMKHGDFVRTCILCRNGQVVTGCDDGYLRVFGTDGSCDEQKIVKAHQFAIYDMQQVGIDGKEVILTNGEDCLYQVKLWR